MLDLSRPLDLTAAEFVNNKWAWLDRLREERPVHQAKISLMKFYTVARYDDCAMLLKDPRFVRNRTLVTGGGNRFPFPLPKSVAALSESMIVSDDPDHRRLRDLVRQAFKPQAIKTLEERIDRYSHELLDGLETTPQFDLQAHYALPIPMRMITDMLGVSQALMPEFQQGFSVLSKGLTGMRILRTLFRDLPALRRLVEQMIAEKRRNPGDDILTGLLEAEADGDRLTQDEILAMVFLLIIAGFETTVHLITNGVHTLLQHPEQLERLRADPDLINTAVEEILRHRGPVQGTKLNYATEDITLHGVTIAKGKPVMPLLGAANHDPRAFDSPLEFDIGRTPNHHLGFGHGVHFCLGAHLARAEARLSLRNLIERLPELALAVPDEQLELQRMPGWHRYTSLPVKTNRRRAAA